MKKSFLPKKLRLRHVAFLLVALAGIALTTFTIIILWRITSPGRFNEGYSGENFIGIIGVLVAFVAAFIGIMVTIMFADVLYNHIETSKKLNEINRFKDSISDLYILALRIEAKENEKEGHFLRAIERRLGELYNAIKMPHIDAIYLFELLEKINKNIELLNTNKVIEYYEKDKKNLIEILKSIKLARSYIDLGINKILEHKNATLVETDLSKTKQDFDSKMERIITEIEKNFKS